MRRFSVHAEKKLQSAWMAVLAGIRAMYGSSDVKPRNGYEVFKLDEGDADAVTFLVSPIVFKVPEKATHRDANLYVVVKGWLSFEPDEAGDAPLRTKSFGTQVGYFRASRDDLKHVYGAHYDLDEAGPGHPVFHSQMTSTMDLAQHIAELYRINADPTDLVNPILKNVRVPSAQMDVFSVIAQVCADHLIYQHSGPEVTAAFSTMRSECDFFMGAAYRLPTLQAGTAPNCYRSTHWYR